MQPKGPVTSVLMAANHITPAAGYNRQRVCFRASASSARPGRRSRRPWSRRPTRRVRCSGSSGAPGSRAARPCSTRPAASGGTPWSSRSAGTTSPAWTSVRPRSVSTPPTSCAPCSVPSAGVRRTCTERSTVRRSRSTRRAWSSSPASSGRPTERKGDASMPADSRPLVVVGAPLHKDAVSILERECRVILTEDPTEEAMIKTAAEAQGILFRGRPRSSASLMEACKRLKVVGRHGVGLDSVDIPAATRLGIAVVVHAPGSNSQAVAEHALMLMLACTKRTLLIDKTTRRGDWGAKRIVGNSELAGKTLGIVGVGNIGRRVAKFAGAIGLRVLGYGKYVPGDEVRRRGAEPVKSFEELLPQVDILTCHTPLTPETKQMINAKTLALMKPGAIFVNTSRGPVQDERALFEALTRGHLAAAGLDVWEEEPTPLDNPIP